MNIFVTLDSELQAVLVTSSKYHNNITTSRICPKTMENLKISKPTNMRTYKRKRQEYQVIDDVQARCRLCLEKAEDPVPIFKEGEDNIAALSLRIMICVGIQLKQEELLPNIICQSCVNNLEYYYKFRKRCEASYQRLNSHMLAMKQNIKFVKMEEEEVREGPEESELVVMDAKDEKVDERPEIQVIEQPEENNGDLQTFLKSILMDLNIIVKTNQGLLVQDQEVTTYELETGDDDVITFELVEEDDELAPTEVTADSIIDKIPNEELDSEKKVVDNGMTKKKKTGWWCRVCGKSFSSSSAGVRHAAAHAGLRPHACRQCARTFAQKAVRDRHMLVHQAQRPFQCPSCDKSFTQRGALASHARQHATPRAIQLHACPHCDKHFLYASGLSRHLSSHAGRAFACAHCRRRFTDRSSLARHARNKHGNKIEHNFT